MEQPRPLRLSILQLNYTAASKRPVGSIRSHFLPSISTFFLFLLAAATYGLLLADVVWERIPRGKRGRVRLEAPRANRRTDRGEKLCVVVHIVAAPRK